MTATSIKKVQPTSPGEEIARLLRDRQMDFDLKEIDFSDIDVEASKHNQARFLPIHDDTVITYAAAMEQGDVFPPIVAWGTKGKYLILDGNHRMAAALMNDYTRGRVFVCKNVTKSQAELFTYEANARHGLPTSIEERIQQAIYLVNIGNQAKAVAKALSVPEQRLYKSLQVARGAARVQKIGIDPKHFTNSELSRLDSVTSNTIMQPIAELSVKANLTYDEMSEIVTQVNSERNGETEQLKVVEKYRDRYAPRLRTTSGGRIELPTNVNRVLLGARMVRKIDGPLLATQMHGIDPALADQVKSEIYEMVASLVSVTESIKHGNSR